MNGKVVKFNVVKGQKGPMGMRIGLCGEEGVVSGLGDALERGNGDENLNRRAKEAIGLDVKEFSTARRVPEGDLEARVAELEKQMKLNGKLKELNERLQSEVDGLLRMTVKQMKIQREAECRGAERERHIAADERDGQKADEDCGVLG